MACLIQTLVGLIVVGLLLLFCVAPIYKYRANIKRWIKEPDYGSICSWEQDGTKKAQRDVTKAEWKLEDAKDYLTYRQNKDKSKEAETGE